MSDPFDSLPATLGGRYTVESELGRGGMATVYLATDHKHERQVAIKVMQPEIAAALGSERFLREIQIAAKLTHPHILPVHDSGELDGTLYYVMPYVEGESLRDRLDRERQLPIDEALKIGRDVGAALGYAHSHGGIHRDIKPENILLMGDEAVVMDFGIARAITEAGGDRLTQTGVAIGTPRYMSPEQSTGESGLDGRTDIYALGSVLYEMLSGEPPYDGATAHAIIAKRLTDPVPSVRRLRETVPPPVDAAIIQALAKAPADRFTTASHFIEALSQPIAAVRPAARTPVNRWVVGAPAALAVGAALWFGLGLGDRIFGGGASVEPVSLVLGASSIPGTDSSLALVMQIALERALVESPVVEVMSTGAVGSALLRMGREPSATLDDSTAMQVAVRTGAAGVVMPGIQRLGATYALSARLVSSEGEVQAIANAQADDSTGLLQAIDILARDLRRQLGESRRSLRQSQDLSFLLTPSLEAVRLTAQAFAVMRSGQTPEYGALLERALALDSNFAMGHVMLVPHRRRLPGAHGAIDRAQRPLVAGEPFLYRNAGSALCLPSPCASSRSGQHHGERSSAYGPQ